MERDQGGRDKETETRPKKARAQERSNYPEKTTAKFLIPKQGEEDLNGERSWRGRCDRGMRCSLRYKHLRGWRLGNPSTRRPERGLRVAARFLPLRRESKPKKGISSLAIRCRMNLKEIFTGTIIKIGVEKYLRK